MRGQTRGNDLKGDQKPYSGWRPILPTARRTPAPHRTHPPSHTHRHPPTHCPAFLRLEENRRCRIAPDRSLSPDKWAYKDLGC